MPNELFYTLVRYVMFLQDIRSGTKGPNVAFISGGYVRSVRKVTPRLELRHIAPSHNDCGSKSDYFRYMWTYDSGVGCL